MLSLISSRAGPGRGRGPGGRTEDRGGPGREAKEEGMKLRS